jgi:hypothetical protein
LTHETSQTHQSAVQFRQSGAGTSGSIPDPMRPNPVAQNAVRGPLYELLQDLTNSDLPSQMPAENAAGSSDPQLDWDAMGDDFEGHLAPSHMQASVAEMAMVLEDWLSNGEIAGDVTSDDELDERSEVSSEVPEPNVEEEQQGMYPVIPHT